MLSAEGVCSKCKKRLSLLSPGLKCTKCGANLHGGCFVPSMNAKDMGKYLVKNKNYYCVSCSKKLKIQNTDRNDSQMNEIEKYLNSIREVRDIITLIEDALYTMTEQCQKLTNSAISTKKDNFELRKRILLHELQGRIIPKNFDEWRSQRKKIGVKDSHKRKRFDSFKADIESKEAFKKVQKLASYVRKVHRWKKKQQKPRKIYSKLSPEDLYKKQIKGAKQKVVYWTQKHFVNFSEGWLIQLLVFILLMIYTLMGAIMFWYVEGRYEQQLVDEILETRSNLFKRYPSPSKINVSQDLNEYYDYMADKFGKNNKLLIRGDDEINWSFFGAMYFCGTTYTTIGYGDITPVTDTGKVLTMFYSLFGIPLFLTLLALLGKNLSNIIKTCATCCPKKKSPMLIEELEDEEKSIVPLWAFIIIDLVYFTCGAVLFMFSEGWSYFESVYFIVITMLTIGFGDYVMSTRTFMIVCVAYVIVGLVVTSMIISLTLDKLKSKFNIANRKLGEAADSYYADEENER